MLSALPTSPEHLGPIVELYRILATTGHPARLEMLGYGARHLQSGEGPARASAFLGTEVPASQLGAFGQYAFSSRLDDALWSVVPLEFSGTDLDVCFGSFRAGAALRAGPIDAHRNELLSHYRSDSPSHCHALGRHLLGSSDEASVLAVGRDRKLSVQVAYYLGLKADVERRLPDAIGWYPIDRK